MKTLKAVRAAAVFTYALCFSHSAAAWDFGDAAYREYCLVDRLSGSVNDVAIHSVARQCGSLPSVSSKIPSWIEYRDYATLDDCILEHASNTPSLKAARRIRFACQVITSRANRRKCAIFLDDLKKTTPGLTPFSRQQILEVLLENPDLNIPDGFDSCLKP